MLKKIISLQIFQKIFYYFSHYENALFLGNFQHFYSECICSSQSHQGSYNPINTSSRWIDHQCEIQLELLARLISLEEVV